MTMRTDPDAQAMQAALEALQWHERRSGQIYGPLKFQAEAITALRERLADSAGAKAEPEAHLCIWRLHGREIHRQYHDETDTMPEQWDDAPPDNIIELFRTPLTHTAAVQEALERAAKTVEDACAWTGGHGEPRTPGGSELAKRIRAIRPEDIKGE